MKIVKWTAIVLGALLVVFIAGAAFIEPAYRVERVTTIEAPADRIYPLIADPRAWTRWTVWNRRDPNMKVGSATRVSWSNEGNVGSNPMMRWFVPFLDGMMGPDFEAGLANLKVLAEKP